MQLGMIGLGRMGANMVRRLQKNGHQCVVFDRSTETVKQLAGEGATGSTSIDDFIGKLQKPRAIWLMVPAAVVDATIADLAPKLSKADILIGGSTSYDTNVSALLTLMAEWSRTDIGYLAPGARADLVMLDAPSHAHLAYRPGVPLVHAVYQSGELHAVS